MFASFVVAYVVDGLSFPCVTPSSFTSEVMLRSPIVGREYVTVKFPLKLEFTIFTDEFIGETTSSNPSLGDVVLYTSVETSAVVNRFDDRVESDVGLCIIDDSSPAFPMPVVNSFVSGMIGIFCSTLDVKNSDGRVVK